MKYLSAFLAVSAVLGVHARPKVPKPDADGRYTLEAEGIKAQFIPYAATLTNLFVKGMNELIHPPAYADSILDKNGVQRDIVLGYDNTSFYRKPPVTTA